MKITAIIIFLLTFNLGFTYAESPNDLSPLKVGLILPLTGALAEYGTAFQNGIELAKIESASISQNCSFVFEDSKYDPKTAVTALHKLRDVDRVSVVYNWGGPTSEALAPLAERTDIVLFVWSADPGVSEGRSNVIRFSNSGLDYGGTIAHYLEAQGKLKVAIVVTDNQYIDAIVNGLKAAETKLKVEIIDNYQPSDQDFRSTISKLKTRNFDALGIFLLSGQVSQFAKQLKAQSVNLPIFGTDFFESMTEVSRSNGALKGAVFANNQVSSRFQEIYTRRFHNDLQINHAANGYDFINFICKDLAKTLSGLDTQQILQKVLQQQSINGEQGQAVLTRSNKGDKYYRFPVVVRKIEENRIITYPLLHNK